MDAGRGSISCGANYIFRARPYFANCVSCGRGCFANSIAYAVVSPRR